MNKRARLDYILQRQSLWEDFWLYGVDLVSEGDRELDCVAYVFGLDYKPSKEESHRLAKDLIPVTDQPQEGDVIIYFDRRVPDFPIHCGVVLNDDRIESKWGNGPVVRHNVSNLPRSCDFGSYRYYKKPI